jgi:hypothetical protein
MSRSGAEVAGVELVGGTNLGRGRGRWMEHDHDRRCKSGRGHAAQESGVDAGWAVRREWGRRDRGQGPSRNRGACNRTDQLYEIK